MAKFKADGRGSRICKSVARPHIYGLTILELMAKMVSVFLDKQRMIHLIHHIRVKHNFSNVVE